MPRRAGERQTRTIVSTLVMLFSITASLPAQRTVTRSIFVNAIDTAGRPVIDLTPADFQVTESGVRRQITRATLGSEPMRIVLMVDSSTPVGPMVNTFKK